LGANIYSMEDFIDEMKKYLKSIDVDHSDHKFFILQLKYKSFSDEDQKYIKDELKRWSREFKSDVKYVREVDPRHKDISDEEFYSLIKD